MIKTYDAARSVLDVFDPTTRPPARLALKEAKNISGFYECHWTPPSS